MTLRKETELDCDFGDCEGILTTAIDKGDELVKIHIERLEARDHEHLAKAEEADEANIELEKSNETLYQQKIKLMSELAKIERMEKECIWKPDAYDESFYESACGLEWSITNERGLKYNHMKFCPKCGGKVIEVCEEAD